MFTSSEAREKSPCKVDSVGRGAVSGLAISKKKKCSFETNTLNGSRNVHGTRNTENKSCSPDVNKLPFLTSKCLSFLSWNVKGLSSKFLVNDFLKYVLSFDFVCLCETFEDEIDETIFDGFKVYYKPALKYSKSKHKSKPGRKAGGIVCLIKNELKRFIIKVLDIKHEYAYAFLVDKRLFGCEKNILYVCIYVPPEGSPFYAHFDYDQGISLLEECLVDLLLTLDDVYIIMCGDFNSRTANMSPHQSLNCRESHYKSCSISSFRCSKDTSLNSYGKSLLNLCTALDLTILNGYCNGDLEGRYTFAGDSGSSVNDYFVLSTDFYEHIFDSCELHIADRIESDHFPVECRVTFPDMTVNKHESDKGLHIEKFVWNIDYSKNFYDKLNDKSIQDRMKTAMELIDIDINKALHLFNSCIVDSASCMQKHIRVGGDGYRENWYDKECYHSRQTVRRLLRKFRKTSNKIDQTAYVRSRREYKNMLIRKKKVFERVMLDKLVNSINNQQEFWKQMKSISVRKKKPEHNISSDDWFHHFKLLLDKESPNNNFDFPFIEHDVLDRPFSREEVIFSLRKIKNGKTPGPDGILGEFLKAPCDEIVDFFVSFLNGLFDKGIFPDSWCESVTVPLFKKGDVSDTNNYRGISLSNIGSKVYGIIINNRLQEYVEQNNITGEHQAGFKRGYSTIDQMFTLLALIQKQFSFNRKLYVAFIDFEKAFDSINRNLLWPILCKNGIQGKLFKCIRSMYDVVKTRIRCGNTLTDYISCTRGVKQGDICSPVLFSLFINELATEIINKGRHGARFTSDLMELFILLLADDIALVSETVVGLQTQLNNLKNSANRLELKVNMNKSNIIVFRKGGYLAARERWIFDGAVMPVVNIYKYLGIFFSTRISFVAACKDLSSRAKRVLLIVLKKLTLLNNNSLELFVKVFDTQIQPVVQYGSEIWGLDRNAAKECESVHLLGLKKFLGVRMKTPNDLVYGDTNRYPIYINSSVNCIRYWLKLLRMDIVRLPRKAYNMLYDLDMKGKCNWVSNIRMCLCENGFGDVWLFQSVGEEKTFLKAFRQRLVDCRWQNWETHIHTSERFGTYKMFSSTHLVKQYLAINIDKHLRFILSRFRFGISEIRVHATRYQNIPLVDLLCPLCKESIEDEMHFVLICPVLSNIRKTFIPEKYYLRPCLFRMCLLMSSENANIVRNVAMYLFKAFQLRKIIIS